MAEFQEVIQQKNRMCQSIACRECGIYRLCSEDLSVCQGLIYNNPKKAEEVIMSWAAEHPEPVYPNWVEWFRQMGIVPLEQKCFHTWLLTPIPADIAVKLGIEPKEASK